ncbi:MAG: SDR family NAD(P)-dependent oxidoreductase [Phycisphaerales bacterium]
MVDLQNKSILISGASSGIGAVTAVACAKAGMNVALMARREDRLAEVAEHIRAHGKRTHLIVGSVDSDADCERALYESQDELGPLHCVLANAGYGGQQLCHTMSIQDTRDMFETNLYGSLRLVLPMIEQFKERGSGHAIMVSSCLSKIGLPNYGPYCATKAAQDYICRGIRLELKGTGVHVSSVHPIGTKTEFFDTASKRIGQDSGPKGMRGYTLQPPERVANAIVRCLRKPKGEVWTSLPTRLAMAGTVVAPSLTDWALARVMRKK